MTNVTSIAIAIEIEANGMKILNHVCFSKTSIKFTIQIPLTTWHTSSKPHFAQWQLASSAPFEIY